MSPVHFHLFFSHFAVAGILIGFLVLLFGKLLKQDAVLKTGLWILFLASFSVFAMNASGEEAEEIVEDIKGVSHLLIHEHEEAAEKTVWVALISGLFSLFTLWALQTGKKFANRLVIGSLVFGALTAAAIFNTARQGGLIRHAEELGEIQEPVETNHDEPSDASSKEY